METLEKAQKALDKAKIQLMMHPDSVFFTTICFNLKHQWNEDIPTARTNGLRIEYSPDFFMSLTEQERLFLVMHEVLHVAFQHMFRLKDRKPKKWNAATDYVINAILIKRGFRMPAGGLYEEKYYEMSAEEIYNILPDNIGPPMDDLMEPGSGEKEGDGGQKADEIKQHLDEILIRASLQAEMAKQGGSVPGALQRYIGKLVNPKLPWNQLLKKYLTKLTKTDYSFRKPNRRFFPTFYLPTLHSESLCEIAVAIDTSGSVREHQFNAFISEVYAILKKEKPHSIDLVQFNSDIVSETRINSVRDLLRVPMSGFGGTNIQPVMEWAKKNQPHVMIIITDGHFKKPTINPKVPIIWVITDNPRYQGRWGKTIHFSTNTT